jgi:hypothetical protein
MNKKKYLKTIQEYIEYFAQDRAIEEYFRKIPEDKLTSNEKQIIQSIYSKLPLLCRRYKNQKIKAEKLQDYASTLLYKKYNPNVLYRILDRNLYDFLMLLDEYKISE